MQVNQIICISTPKTYMQLDVGATMHTRYCTTISLCATRRASPYGIEDRETGQLDSLHQERPASEGTSEDGRVVTTASDSHSEANEEDAEPQPGTPAFNHGTSALPGGVAS